MVIHPATAVANSWVVGDIGSYEIGAVGILFPLDTLFILHKHNSFHIGHEGFQPRGMKVQEPTAERRNPSHKYWRLANNFCYIGQTNMEVIVPEGVVATIHTLPEFMANGVIIQTSIIPGGYRGQLEYTIQNIFGDTYVTTGTMIGSLIFMEMTDEYPSQPRFA